MIASSREDPCSCAEPTRYRTKHIEISWNVDFDKRIISGQVVLHVETGDEGDILALDTRDLDIKKVWNVSTTADLSWKCEDFSFSAYGSKLLVTLPKDVPKHRECTLCVVRIGISYCTSPNSSALQWLNPEQTAGKVYPYLFSQCQAIHARSLLPCQDTPGIKITYEAQVRIKAPLVVVMSAVRSGDTNDCGDTGEVIYHFQQKVPIPSYLIAIAAGALQSRQIGPRSHVWCEREMIDAAAFEFAEVENMLQTAESYMGPYVWGAYDILVLPPSFPYGGMENPCLTFATPTILAGDRSLADVIAHEISHSWTGNLVTNASWQHFWLNEGFTTFLERKISARLHGNNEKYRHFLAINGLKSLRYCVTEQYSPTSSHTQLVQDLTDTDPDDAFSTVPYEKGHTFLFYLEQKVGGTAAFEGFLRAFIEEFKYKTLTTAEWKTFLLNFFKDLAAKGVFDDVDWDAWFYSPGLPPVIPQYDTTYVQTCTDLCDRWVTAVEGDLGKFSSSDLANMAPMQIIEFLAQLLIKDPLPQWKLDAMQKTYNFNATKNSDLRFNWLRLGLRAHWEPAIAHALDMVTIQGRMRYTRPLYRDLYAWEKSRGVAIQTFKENRKFMHHTTSSLVAKDLKIE